LSETVAAVFFEFIWKIHYGNCFEGAFFDAYAAAAAEPFGDDGFSALNADGFYVAAYHGAEADAVLVALLDFASVNIENSYACHFWLNSEVDWVGYKPKATNGAKKNTKKLKNIVHFVQFFLLCTT
jgi:hypothetical protein